MSFPTGLLRYAGVWNSAATYEYGMFVIASDNNAYGCGVASSSGVDPATQPSADWFLYPSAAPGGGTITGVTPGTGISGGGSAGNVTVTNDGVLELTQGSNITITGTKANYTIAAATSGGTITGVTAGTGISGGGSSGTVTVTNDGVLELTQGSNITITGTKSNYTIAAATSGGTLTGVGVGANGGLTVNTTNPTVPVLTNEGVLELTQGSNITITGTKSNYTIAAATSGGTLTGVGVGANGGLTVNTTNPTVPVLTNEGVLELTQGSNITITGTKSNYTIAAATSGGTITGVTAGTGISGGGSAGNVTVTNAGVLSLNSLTGTITLAAGTNISLVPVGNVITINQTNQPVTNRSSSTTPVLITATTYGTAQTLASLTLPTTAIYDIDVFAVSVLTTNSNTITDMNLFITIDGTPVGQTFSSSMNGVGHFLSMPNQCTLLAASAATHTILLKGYASSANVITVNSHQISAIGNLA